MTPSHSPGNDATPAADTNPSSAQLGAKPIKRKHGDDHEPSKTPRVERCAPEECPEEYLDEEDASDQGSDEESEEQEEDDDDDEDDEDDEDDDDDDDDGGGEDGEDDEDDDDDEDEGEDREEEEDIPSHWRAILSFHDMINDPSSAGPKYNELDAEQKIIIALGVRNLFLATSRSSSVRDRDRQILENMKGVLEEVTHPAVVKESGLEISFYPGRKHSQLRHILDLDTKIGEHPHKSYFAQLVTTPRVFAAFVQPRE